jgi:hypothetical protein
MHYPDKALKIITDPDSGTDPKTRRGDKKHEGFKKCVQ